MVSLFGKAGKGGREGEKAVCSEGQHSGPGLVLNRLCRVRPGPRWDSLSPPQTLSDSIQGLHCPRFCSGAGQKPELPGWEVSRGLQPPPTPQPQIPLCPCSHPAPVRDQEVPSPSHTQPQIPLCPLQSPMPLRETGRCPACHIHPASTVTVPWNTSGVTGRRNALFSRSLFSFQSDPLSVSSSGPRAPTQGWQDVRVQGVSPTP